MKLHLRPAEDVKNLPNRPTAEVLDDILGRAVFLGASDIHIEAYEADVDVRIRIDGVLHQMNHPLSPNTLAAVVSRLKILARLDIAERRQAQDGRVQAIYAASGPPRAIDFRLSVIPGPFGENVVLRVLDGQKTVLGLEALGMTPDLLNVLYPLVESPDGLFLVNGPTGSGKTTTLYAILNHINSDANKILTIEDPIEYHFGKINQMQIGPTMGFADYARAFLRHDPEVMMIGEVRDEPTADIAIRAALTGHLVLSTAHANDAVSAVARLRTLDVAPELIADALLASLSQRLVRKLCDTCSTTDPVHSPERAALETFGIRPARYRGPGCPTCHQTGYAGRTGVHELFVNDAEVSELIAADVAPQRIRHQARQKGMKTILEDGLAKVEAGLTDVAELKRVISHRLFSEHRHHELAHDLV